MNTDLIPIKQICDYRNRSVQDLCPHRTVLKQKSPVRRIGPGFIKNDILYSNDCPGLGVVIIQHVHVGAITLFGLERNGSVRQGVEGEILAHAYITARVKFGASLAYKDIACSGCLATEKFYSESFTLTVSVTASVLGHVKGDKVIVFKKKRRKGYRVKNGHRQQFTKVRIDSISI